MKGPRVRQRVFPDMGADEPVPAGPIVSAPCTYHYTKFVLARMHIPVGDSPQSRPTPAPKDRRRCTGRDIHNSYRLQATCPGERPGRRMERFFRRLRRIARTGRTFPAVSRLRLHRRPPQRGIQRLGGLDIVPPWATITATHDEIRPANHEDRRCPFTSTSAKTARPPASCW